MKNYINLLVIALVLSGSYSYADMLSAAQTNPVIILPITTGPDSIVDAIKQYSNLTDADVNQWKFLWLGALDVVPAVLIGGAATYKAGVAAGGAGELLQQTPDWLVAHMPTPPEILKKSGSWVIAGAVIAGLLSYKVLYSRIRYGVLDKVQKFINVCSGLTIATIMVNQINPFPVEWNTGGNVALCKALNNLVDQGRCALALLNQVGTNDVEVQRMRFAVQGYYANLQYNQGYFSGTCNQLVQVEQQQEDAALQREGVQAQIFGMKIQNVKNVLSIIEKVGGFLYRGARDMIKWSVDNPAPAGLLGMAAYYWKTRK
jgi:hypothetical protein